MFQFAFILAVGTPTPHVADWGKCMPRSPEYHLGTPQTDLALNVVVIAKVSTSCTQQVY